MIIVLMGYMGSGKTTVGKKLAEVLKYKFTDLDHYIENKENLLIPEIFNSKGQIYFRKKEAEYLNNILNDSDNIILSLGGGTPCYGVNLNSILNTNNIVSFYLKASIVSLIDRLWVEKDSRPLIKEIDSKDNFAEFIGKHLFERTQFYSKSNHTINTDSKSISTIVEDIVVCLV